MKPLRKRIVDLSAIASGEDRDAAVFFESLEEIVDLDIDVTIVAALQLGTFAKKRIDFVEKEDRTILLCCSEDAPQILFRLANVFRDDGARPIFAVSRTRTLFRCDLRMRLRLASHRILRK